MKAKNWNLWVFLHWLMALLVVGLFFIGQLKLNTLVSADDKALPLTIHIISGVLLLAVALARLILRKKVTNKPFFSRYVAGKRANSVDMLDTYAKPALYIVTILMCLAGISVSIPADLFGTLILRNGATLPADFNIFPARQLHAGLSILLTVLVIIHLLAFVQHQFLFKEKYLKKMWFIKRKEK